MATQPPKANPILHYLGRVFLFLLGWRVVGDARQYPKAVLIAAPHTSNWDFIYGLAIAWSLNIKFSFIGKDSLFRGPLGTVMQALGGIPVNRHERKNAVQQIVDIFNEREALILGIAPEGTRRRVEYWKTGFYYMALEANVPILLGFFDYERKIGGMGSYIFPTGDIQADMQLIHDFYADKKGKNPEAFGAVQIRPAS